MKKDDKKKIEKFIDYLRIIHSNCENSIRFWVEKDKKETLIRENLAKFLFIQKNTKTYYPLHLVRSAFSEKFKHCFVKWFSIFYKIRCMTSTFYYQKIRISNFIVDSFRIFRRGEYIEFPN